MTAVPALAAVVLLTVAAPVVAQVPHGWQARPGAPAFDPHRYQADRHRYEIERLRAQADQREAFALQQQTDTRLNRIEIEARRQPTPIQPAPQRALRSPEDERASRLSAQDRARTLSDGVGEIDAWLDRPVP